MRSAYTNRGVFYGLEGDHERAIMDFDRAVEIDPKLAKAYANRGASYLRKGDVDRALPITTGPLSSSRKPRRLLPAGRRQT